jgi:hypothetical protein
MAIYNGDWAARLPRVGDGRLRREVFYGTQYHPTVVQWYYLFFSFFTMGKKIIYSMYIIWKIFSHYQGYIK